MTSPRYFSIVCGLLLAAPPLFAQPAAATDRVGLGEGRFASGILEGLGRTYNMVGRA